MPKRYGDKNVFDAALERIVNIYKEGHTIVVSFSGGKDSGVCVELSIMAAKITGRLPINVMMRDEEIMFPGTFEYAERMAKREEINFHWIYACQPVINIFNRKMPYYWVFDPLLKPDQWVRKPPEIAYKIDDLSIGRMVTEKRFPVKEGKKLISMTGITVYESLNRRMAIASSRGYMTRHKADETYLARPIYDWHAGDVWKSIKDNKWDHNTAYDVMVRHGIPKHKLRIAPPFMHSLGILQLQKAAAAYPTWFNTVCKRLDGVRNGVYFGKKSIEPLRHLHETWEDCFNRTCIKDAPNWIAERATKLKEEITRRHSNHSREPMSQKGHCSSCGQVCSWEKLTKAIYNGDPFNSKIGSSTSIKPIEPDFFRTGSGKWGGKPAW